MFSTIAGHVKSAFHGAPVARLAEPSALAVARVAPGRHTLLTSSGAPRAWDIAPSVRSRSASFGVPGRPQPRDWPTAGDVQRGTPEGIAAARAANRAPQDRAISREIRERAFRTGEAIEPGYAATVTGMNMVFGLSRPTERLLSEDGPGVADGLRALAIAPGDAVAELDPDSPGLVVRLTLEGARTFLALSHPARHREVSAQLERFAQGTTDPVRELGPDFKPLHPPQYYADGARKVAQALTLVRGPGFGALPQGIPFKALIARGAFEYLDAQALEAALEEAGRILQPGGGLVFEFAHAAGTPSHPQARTKLNRTTFRKLDEPARRAGLALQCINVRFRPASHPQQQLIAARRVQGDAQGHVDPTLADWAAYTGWNEIARLKDHEAQPVLIDVSGVFVKRAPATR